MKEPIFSPFTLVGGTALSLQRGHRKSVDIDLFTDAEYGSIDFEQIGCYFNANFPYVDSSKQNLIGFGKSYFLGKDSIDCIKLDLYYTDPFVFEIFNIENIRIASLKEIIAMKLDVIQRIGRKKDFWDIHELISDYELEKMLSFHLERYPYNHNRTEILHNLTHFEQAENDFDPICLRANYWELIQLDLIDFVNKLS